MGLCDNGKSYIPIMEDKNYLSVFMEYLSRAPLHRYQIDSAYACIFMYLSC